MAERQLYYLDFENGEFKEFEAGDSIPPSVMQLPIGYVVANVTNTDPATELGYGSWDLIGTQLIGIQTVYYFENVAP